MYDSSRYDDDARASDIHVVHISSVRQVSKSSPMELLSLDSIYLQYLEFSILG